MTDACIGPPRLIVASRQLHPTPDSQDAVASTASNKGPVATSIRIAVLFVSPWGFVCSTAPHRARVETSRIHRNPEDRQFGNEIVQGFMSSTKYTLLSRKQLLAERWLASPLPLPRQHLSGG